MIQLNKFLARIKKAISCKKGEMYFDSAISMVMLVMVVAVSLNVFQFFTLKTDMDYISKELIYVATMHGTTNDIEGSPVGDRLSELEEETGLDVEVTWNVPDGYFNNGNKTVQYGDRINVAITYDLKLTGLGAKALSGQLTATRSGLSEKYWK